MTTAKIETTTVANDAYETMSYTKEYVLERVCPNKTPEVAYQVALYGWRQDNFHKLGPKPKILNYGNPETGVGFEIVQPVIGLHEKIIGHSQDKNNGTIGLYFAPLNPKWYTFPVKNYMTHLTFTKTEDGTGTKIRWHSKYTPLLCSGILVHFFISTTLSAYTKYIINNDKTEKKIN